MLRGRVWVCLRDRKMGCFVEVGQHVSLVLPSSHYRLTDLSTDW